MAGPRRDGWPTRSPASSSVDWVCVKTVDGNREGGMVQIGYTTCPLCEATCGLELTLSGDRVTGVRGDADDVFSHGFLCPKGASLAQLEEDPDRLRTPRVRRD